MSNDQEKIHRLMGKVELNGSRNQPQVRSDLSEEAFVLVSRTVQRCYKLFFVTNTSGTLHFITVSQIIQSLNILTLCHIYFNFLKLYIRVTHNSITLHCTFVSHTLQSHYDLFL